MRTAKSIQLDRRVFSVVSFDEAEKESKTYWLGKDPYERLEALEITRQVLYGYDPTTLRLQRVLEITERI